MKILLLLLMTLTFACKPEPVQAPPLKTRPVRPYEPKRMVAESEKMIVAVIDTGFTTKVVSAKPNFCKKGHKNFSNDETTSTQWNTDDPVPVDTIGHGTNIVGLIETYAKNTDAYCIVVLKVWSTKNDGTLQASLNAFRYAKEIGARIINYSAGGNNFSATEAATIKDVIDNGSIVVAAAGNDSANLANAPYYPAMSDPRVVVVGNANKTNRAFLDLLDEKDKDLKTVYLDNFNQLGFAAPSSNYGTRVNRWENGNVVRGYDVIMTGTSQATAIATGKIVNDLKK